MAKFSVFVGVLLSACVVSVAGFDMLKARDEKIFKAVHDYDVAGAEYMNTPLSTRDASKLKTFVTDDFKNCINGACQSQDEFLGAWSSIKSLLGPEETVLMVSDMSKTIVRKVVYSAEFDSGCKEIYSDLQLVKFNDAGKITVLENYLEDATMIRLGKCAAPKEEL
eukprot:CAMPEP_0181299120 /NCGR_PEP_ID=MMETSP1101-20121128/6165_1 /TAXON_ID=46948 /ORGANISM="Rhodomonas abbreviata, Strain Caron Lab Isolate" /LENGTH=165 /DNA_ID=CAMNT_0023404225 /DNA_START=86 /DNA_END=583 /DNA_ORIENTATION=+